MTITEKILVSHAKVDYVSPGDLIKVSVDLALANDITAPLAIQVFREIAVVGSQKAGIQNLALDLEGKTGQTHAPETPVRKEDQIVRCYFRNRRKKIPKVIARIQIDPHPAEFAGEEAVRLLKLNGSAALRTLVLNLKAGGHLWRTCGGAGLRPAKRPD